MTDADAVDAIPVFTAMLWAIMYACEIAELGVADALGEEAESAAQLAAKVGADPGALRRVMRYLATYGFFTAERDGRFAHSPLSRVMRKDHPQSRRDYLRLGSTKVHLKILSELGHALKTGRPAAEVAFPEGIFTYLASHPDESLVFDQAMTAKSHTEIAAVLRAYDFSRFRRIADIGGGRGHLLQAVLDVVPQATGVVFDLPHVIRSSASPSGRITFQAGDFFKDPLPVCDAYLIKAVLHDWSDEEALRILNSIRRAAPAGAHLLVMDAELPSGPEPHPAKYLDVVMLGWATGRERTAAEFEKLFAAADFRLARVIPASSEISIYEGIAGSA
jgi:hypothetical protein